MDVRLHVVSFDLSVFYRDYLSMLRSSLEPIDTNTRIDSIHTYVSRWLVVGIFPREKERSDDEPKDVSRTFRYRIEEKGIRIQRFVSILFQQDMQRNPTWTRYHPTVDLCFFFFCLDGTLGWNETYVDPYPFLKK